MDLVDLAGMAGAFTGMLVKYVIIGLVFGLLVSSIADYKGYKRKQYFWLGFFLNIVGFIIILCQPKIKKPEVEEADTVG